MFTDVYVWVLCLHYSPLLAVLAHAYSSAVARGRVAAWTLTHLKANTAGGAAGRPGSPGGPRSISMVTDEVMSVCDFSHWLRSCAIGLACTRLSCLYCLRRRSWLRSHSSSHVAQRNSTTFLRANTEKHAAIHHHIHTYGQFSHTGRVRTSLQSEPSPFLAMVLTTSPLCCLRAIRPIFVAHIKGKWASETNQIKGCVFTCLFHFKCNNRLRVWDKHLWLCSDIYYCKRLIDCF